MMKSSLAKPKLIYLLGLVLPLHFLTALPFFGIWFLPDDFVSIYGSMQNPLKLLFSRETYALFNRWFFTPLLPISFKLDWHLFRLNPIGYHFHNYLVILMSALVIYKIARFYLPSFYAFLSSIFFLFSIPAFMNVGALSWRHYIWGCLFTLLGFYLYKCFEQTNIKKFLVYSITSYFIAILFKSAFAPLPLAIFLLSELRPYKRLKIFSIYMSVFLFYLAWRFYILGGLGGYFFIPSLTVLDAILAVLFKIPYTISKNIWGIPFFIYFISIGLCLLRLKLGITIFFLSLISISPFIFTSIGKSYSFAAKFMVLCTVMSLALSFFIYHITTKLRKDLQNYVCPLMCVLILTSQLINLPRAFSELNTPAKFIKSTCYKSLNQHIKVLYDPYVWIYNYFYLVQSQLLKEKLSLIGIGTIDRDALPLDLYLYQKYIDSLSESDVIFIPSQSKVLKYRNLKGILKTMEQKQILKKPDIRLNSQSNILKAKIVGTKANGFFKAYFFSRLGEQNIMFYGIPINRKSFSCPIRRGEAVLFLYISSDGKFSEPLLFKETNSIKND